MNKGYALGGRYEIIRQLGEGGMADVYLAFDRILHRQVAVKLLRLDFRDNPKAKERFDHEATAASGLNNPHIVGVYDVDEVEGMQYLVMEYVDGEDLKQYIHDHSPIDKPTVINIMEQIGSAVEEAHKSGLIHRDLKPQNVLIDKNGYVKITDFGISRAASEDTMTQTRSIIGSIHYLSPEQVKGQMATKQSDIYSLGIILFELLTGKVPFDGETAVSIAMKHSQESIPSVRTIDPTIPQSLENVVLKATAKNPDDRYATVSDFNDDLKTSLSADRSGEAKFVVPSDGDDGETRVMPFAPLKENTALADDKPKSSTKSEETPVEKPQKKRKHRKLKIFIWALLVALLGFLIFAIASSTSNAKVPETNGLVETDAKQKIEDAHLEVGKITFRSSYTIDKGRVIASDPDAGKKVDRNSKVNLVVSSGIKKIRIENYVGQQYKKVARHLKNEGVTVVRRNSPSSTFAAGKILQQDIAAKKRVDPKKTTITFVVSTGIKQIQLKDLTGMTKQQVVNYANEVELNPTFDYEYSDQQKSGRVISTTPKAGVNIQQGSNVAVTISRGKKPVKQKKQEQLRSFNVRITIPFHEDTTNVLNQEQEESSDSAASGSDTQESRKIISQNSSSVPDENVILIYLKDHDHDYSTVYKQMVINKDTTVLLPFKLLDSENGKYKVVRDGQTILRDNNVTYDSH
ncbi:Stk1 family PASTA domain-containing Ser/Thr kinase [Lentilactobacillus sp. Marseille-Q4993]|uniref:Stk1 family PASTA domain-containing Ser/Thr kinase n=1 Tax=Lentilactobacillus sp. Marseille-Q4993 TaxID=3039492 RepID=UPI0024BD1FE3|nr:Stk1 family PASTA domain-containing Ser/Thr kinase [Lentilactobacillus sp. Marseille-Q4993]